ncbi:TPA: helix-turn-helix domain-containing protein [Stenotrophomonas maltophilia]
MNTKVDQAGFDVVDTMPIATPDEVFSTRQLLAMTQTEFAKEMGVTEFTIWRWENGRRQPSEAQTRALRELGELRIFSQPGDSEASSK